MAVIGYREPNLVGTPNNKEPKQLLVAGAQNAAWRRGSVLRQVATGTAVVIAPGGALATQPGPAASAVTLGTTTAGSAGNPPTTYYVAVTYTATAGQESQPSYYIINAPAGTAPQVSVAAAGAPVGATNFAAYFGIIPNYYVLQQANKITTLLGATFTAAYPLANNSGVNQAITATATNIVGIALEDSYATFFDGGGGSFTAGTNLSRLGASVSVPPLTPFEAQGHYILGLGFGQIVEMNLINTVIFQQGLLNTQAGLTLDAATGFFVVDPAQAACLTIVGQRDGVYIGPTAPGTFGDLGARVDVVFNAAALALS